MKTSLLKTPLPLLSLLLSTIPLISCASSNSAHSTGSTTTGASATISPMQQIVDSNMQTYMNRYDIPGAIVGISVKGVRTYYAYGTATDAGAPFTPQTLVEIGSCTKTFTTTLLSLAAARQQMQLNASVSNYMPAGYTMTQSSITPLQLADFQSGLPDNIPHKTQTPLPDIDTYTEADFLTWISGWTGISPVKYEYSNTGVGFLTYLIQQATGIPWLQQIQTEITGPLQMVDTVETPSASQQARLATGHMQHNLDAQPWPVYAWFGAGVLRSTAADMLSYGEANLGHAQVNGQPVPASLLAAMKTAQTSIYDSGTGQQGMAWFTELNVDPGTNTNGPAETMKDGGTAGFSTTILVIPSMDTAIFIAANQGVDGEAPDAGPQPDPTPAARQIGIQLFQAAK